MIAQKFHICDWVPIFSRFSVKSQGLFDHFRRECLADVDTKPAYQNLQHRVETSVATFLSDQMWTPELNKNQLREKLRKNITE